MRTSEAERAHRIVPSYRSQVRVQRLFMLLARARVEAAFGMLSSGFVHGDGVLVAVEAPERARRVFSVLIDHIKAT